MAFDFKTIKTWLNDYAGQLKKIRVDIEALEVEREDVLFAPPVQGDVRAALVRWVEGQRDAYQATLTQNLTSLAGQRNVIEAPDMLAKAMFQHPFMRVADTTSAFARGDNDRVICGLFGDLMLKSIDSTLNQIEWPKEGLSATDRARRLEELDKKLKALRAEEQAFVSAATDTGIDVTAVE